MRRPDNQNPLLGQYLGVILRHGAYRIVVSANGNRYYLQNEKPNGLFYPCTHSTSRDGFIQAVSKSWDKSVSSGHAQGPCPFTADALAHLTDDPRDYPRSWVGHDVLAQEAYERSIQEAYKADRTTFELARDNKSRLLRAACGTFYMIQRQSGDGLWRTKANVATLDQLLSVVISEGALPPPNGFYIKSHKLREFAHDLTFNECEVAL
jgi:hypothetical protein